MDDAGKPPSTYHMLEHVYLSKKGLKSGDSLLFVRCGRRMSHRKFGYPSHSPVDFFPGSVLLTTKKKIWVGVVFIDLVWFPCYKIKLIRLQHGFYC
ncbi:uncharacterized protein LOC110920911 isoform X3 [Helianthus annuus]|uniref:uncharacterized protein LOC110920911 isoform X3 n=1 Tax=Helianthus annuus TaxID=4232 RepID=UPI000B9038F4|nr:uncharacterized protein LOC110920911 isoform X3 [Helianthus annuus]